MTLSTWRLAASEIAATPADMLSGRGAFLYGGRWNTEGTRLVNLGGSLSRATLEILVNAPNAASVVRVHYRCLALSFDGDLVRYVDTSELPDN